MRININYYQRDFIKRLQRGYDTRDLNAYQLYYYFSNIIYNMVGGKA